MITLGKQFLTHVVPGILKPIRVLWNEVIGFVFIALAVWAIPSTYRHVRDFSGDAESLFRVLLSGIFAALMLWFGVTSFLRARRLSRQ